jgi:retron-type reverse transcriptase
MKVKASMPVHRNLVAPLPHEGTDMHVTDTTATVRAASGAATILIGGCLRDVGFHSATTAPPTPGTATSTTATSTTTTSRSRAEPEPSADSDLFALLVQAYLDCRRTKRNSASALAFEARLESNLLELHEELAAGVYTPGQAICFVITRPKPREVWAAQFRDRVVHHLLYNRIADRFHRAFIADSCACIPGRGTLYAARRLEHHVRSVSANWSRPASYLKADLANFFVSIDKAVILGQLRARVHEPWWMRLAETILMHDPRADVEVRGYRQRLALVPPHKSLFNAPDGHGLPIGNLSSQFFANVLLDPLDQWVKHRLRVPYVRYVDDFILLHQDARILAAMLPGIEAKLAELHLALNPSKTVLQPVARGIDFVGLVLKPWRRTTRPRTLSVALERVQTSAPEDLLQTANSYFGLLRQATHSHAERARLANVLRRRGHCVSGALTKAYPSQQVQP